MSEPRRPVPCDYDADPARFGLARAVLERHAAAPDVHAAVARRFTGEGLTPVLDIGCGEGELARHLPDGAWTGVDSSATMAARAGAGVADATALPFEDGSFGAAALLYVLYHLDAPGRALSERAACCGRAGSSPWRPRAATTRPSWRGCSRAAR